MFISKMSDFVEKSEKMNLDRDSMRSKSTRRISWGISKRNGFNVSVEDLRHRSTKIVVLGKGNVGKTGIFYFLYYQIIRQ